MIKLPFLSKKNLLTILLVLWVIFSVGYIGWNIWSDFRVEMLNRAYQQGITDAVNQLISQAEKECKPVTVFNQAENKQIELVNAVCLKDN